MKERPIIFSAPMVRAILSGTKTQTRRVVKLLYGADVVVVNGQVWKPARVDYAGYVDCLYGQPGDKLWVRETWKHIEGGGIYDAAGGLMDSHDDEKIYRATRPSYPGPWKSSIHMPRWASRITLEITGVRVERLQDISEGDALAEGCSSTAVVHEDGEDYTGHYASEDYRDLWESINGPAAGSSTPGCGCWSSNNWRPYELL